MTASVATEFELDWKQWHAAREDVLRARHGWLSLTALHWITDVDASYPDLPGTWRVRGSHVVVAAEKSEGLSYAETIVDGDLVLTPVEGTPGLELRVDDRVIEVIRRTGNVALRVHDPKAPELAEFDGVPTFAPAPRWQVAGRFEPYAQPRTITTGAVVEGLEHHHTAVGTLTFEIGGVAQTLAAFGGGTGDLKVLFTDATSGVTTYSAARNLSVDTPADDGSVVIDFNRAINLPCAFTDYATCPVAPAENRIGVAVEAGEKSPTRGGKR